MPRSPCLSTKTITILLASCYASTVAAQGMGGVGAWCSPSFGGVSKKIYSHFHVNYADGGLSVSDAPILEQSASMGEGTTEGFVSRVLVGSIWLLGICVSELGRQGDLNTPSKAKALFPLSATVRGGVEKLQQQRLGVHHRCRIKSCSYGVGCIIAETCNDSNPIRAYVTTVGQDSLSVLFS